MTQHTSPFNAIRQQAEDGSEYWSARQLYKLLGYSTWQKFQVAIEQAKKACENSGQAISDHFNLQVKMVSIGSGATMPEDLPTPEKSIEQIQREEHKRLIADKQPSLFDD